MANNIVLVGPMGAGKSTIGRQLSTRLDYEFLDTDHIIESRAGADIPWIFDVEGEQGFRDREANILAEIIDRDAVVIATGGGIVMRPENRKLLAQSAMVIYLMASIDQLVKRTFKDKKRPLLQVDNPKQKIQELYERRDPIYREVADRIVVTDNGGTKLIVQKISEILSK